ncbi:hypothetical protein E3N88_21240 [Mikania micrantha]|uniref:Stress up-regulated Nod 19 n=1 Tax=Mikania micrantha TaxID=192012 RepID=A0A5N6NM19_9ASTR|nr:hypothetical protein E3N88_21240 [Mikania micrantha]
MSSGTQGVMFLLAIMVSWAIDIFAHNSEVHVKLENRLKSKVYLSPKITQFPGSVSNKTYYDIKFPKGHIAVKSFNAEVVDEAGDPVSLQETYVHHWFAVRYYQNKVSKDIIIAGNSGLICNLYNVTVDKDGRPLRPNYVGGLYCCYDGTQCKVKNGVRNVSRNVYLKYTVKWVDWSDSIVPVKVFIFDVTDTWQHTGIHKCLFEYDVKKSTTGVATNNYTSSRRSSVSFPTAGDVVYGFAQQYIGGTGASLYGEDGRVICSSKPIYGKGNDVGDEAGYIVGMSTCYPKPGSVKIAKGETVTLESNYSSKKMHTGVLGLFYLLVAESS